MVKPDFNYEVREIAGRRVNLPIPAVVLGPSSGDPFEDGKRACRSGGLKSSNPYWDGTEDAIFWERGWLSMHQMFMMDLRERSAQ